MNRNAVTLVALICFLLFAPRLSAQSKFSKYEIGVGVHALVYQGDLTSSSLGSLKTMTPGFSVQLNRFISNSFTAALSFNAGNLKANDLKYANATDQDYRNYRAFKAKTSVRELALQVQWKPLGNREYEPRFDPYLFAGAGLGFVNAKRDYSGLVPEYFVGKSDIVNQLAADLRQDEKRTVTVLPVGAGIRYNTPGPWSIALEGNYRFVQSDYLDGYSLSVNPEQRDAFYSVGLKAFYNFGKQNGGGKGLGCPRP